MKNLVFFLSVLSVLVSWARVDVVAVYYPHWHRYPKGDEWFGSRFDWSEGEWTFVKTARPLFPGHNQPLVPQAGYLKGDSPEDMEKEIALASNAGIDVFLYDYYYYGGRVTQEESLENGFLKARNRNWMKFALMWCYHERHDQFRPKRGAERRMLMELAHTKEELLGLVDLSIERYFRRPEYWRKDGKLFFSIYNAGYFIKTVGEDVVRAALQEARRRVRAAGLGEIHFNAQCLKPDSYDRASALGFDSATDYNIGPNTPDCCEMYRKGVREVDYGVIISENERRWQACRGRALPYFPSVTTGWDRTPRCRPDEPYPWHGEREDYPYQMTVTNNTPDRFEAYLRKAKEIADRNPESSAIVYINGWNEYTEGAWLVPDGFHADYALRAIASVFGRHPRNEYTFVDPVTKELLTVPSATYEGVPYARDDCKQKVDVWLPTGCERRTPVLIYMHGGGWTGGATVDRIIGRSLPRLLKNGIAVVAVGYRYLRDVPKDEGAFPVTGCLSDCEKAVRLVLANVGKWNLDVASVALAGGSAGACTALSLSLGDGNCLGVRAVGAAIPQTSLDPVEMRAWIPGISYGAHAFGYGSFGEWLAHRQACLQTIDRISPVALLRRVDPRRAPQFVLESSAGLRNDATHSPVFVSKFREAADRRGVSCEVLESGALPDFGEMFERLSAILTTK